MSSSLGKAQSRDAALEMLPFLQVPSLCRMCRCRHQTESHLQLANSICNQEMHFYHTNCGIVTSYSLPLGVWLSPGELQHFLTINTGNNNWVSNFPCKQPMYCLWMRCYLHPSRVTFNPKSTMMKHLSCQKKRCAYLHSPQQHLSTPFPTTSTALTL